MTTGERMSLEERLLEAADKLKEQKPFPVCPFDRRSPDYWTTSNDKPCFVCGGTEEVDKCRGADMRSVDAAEALLREAAEVNRELVDGLRWYEQQARDCRKIHREGEVARRALDHDGGDQARALIAKMEGR